MKTRIASLFCGVVSLLAAFVFLNSYGCSAGKVVQKDQDTQEIQYRTISLEDYKDKVAGGWLGQATGVLFGQDTEFNWVGKIVPFDLEDWYRLDPDIRRQVWLSIDTTAARESGDWSEYRTKLGKIISDKKIWEVYTPVQMSNQDDLYLEFLFLHSIQEHGLDVTGLEMAKDWVSYLDSNRIWVANKSAYRNFLKGIWPPMSGHPSNTPDANAIDFQIESDLFGLISPGLPRVSNAWADKVGHMMNYGDGVYAGMAVAAMYGEAFFESDPRKLVEYSLLAIPAESGYAEMVRDVIAAHDKYPDWQDAWQELESKWAKYGGIDVRINGAYIYMGLLYGDGDFWKTMNISMRCGRDSDCNPSNAAGILGTAMGMKGTPEKWAILRDLPIDNTSGSSGEATLKEIYPNSISWDEIIDATVEVGMQNILANGGKIEDGMIYIPHLTPTTTAFEQVPVPEASQEE